MSIRAKPLFIQDGGYTFHFFDPKKWETDFWLKKNIVQGSLKVLQLIDYPASPPLKGPGQGPNRDGFCEFWEL